MPKDATDNEKIATKSNGDKCLKPDPTYPAKSDTPPPYDDDGASMNTAAYCKLDSSPDFSDGETIAPPPYSSQLALVGPPGSISEAESNQHPDSENSTPGNSSQTMRRPKQPLKIHDEDGYVVFHMRKAFTDSLRVAGVSEAPMTEEQERIMRNEAEMRSEREASQREAKLVEKDLLYESDEEDELDLGSSEDEEEELRECNGGNKGEREEKLTILDL